MKGKIFIINPAIDFRCVALFNVHIINQHPSNNIMAKDWLLNKRLVIIGGTAGMGLSAAVACIEEGAKVVVIGKNPEHIEEANTQLKNNGIVITGDATNETVAEQAIQA